MTEPTFLDGSVPNWGQGQEGSLRYLEGIKNNYRFYILKPRQHLTDDDYVTLWNDSDYFIDFQPTRAWKQLTVTQQVQHHEAHSLVLDKIDLDKTRININKLLEKAKAESNKSHAGHTLGAREFTLTYSPKWFSDEQARDLFRKAINKLIKYYDTDIIQLRAVGEVGSNGLSHVHCFYKLRQGLKITDKNFKRAYKCWNPKKVTSRTGHEGGHHANVRNESDFQGYIDKDVEVAWMDVYYPPLPADPMVEVDPA